MLFRRHWKRTVKPARRGRTGGAGIGWALLFLTTGRMPPPPPETQIEVEVNGEKDRGSAGPRSLEDAD